jgi:hypothetical protein
MVSSLETEWVIFITEVHKTTAVISIQGSLKLQAQYKGILIVHSINIHESMKPRNVPHHLRDQNAASSLRATSTPGS